MALKRVFSQGITAISLSVDGASPLPLGRTSRSRTTFERAFLLAPMLSTMPPLPPLASLKCTAMTNTAIVSSQRSRTSRTCGRVTPERCNPSPRNRFWRGTPRSQDSTRVTQIPTRAPICKRRSRGSSETAFRTGKSRLATSPLIRPIGWRSKPSRGFLRTSTLASPCPMRGSTPSRSLTASSGAPPRGRPE